MARRRQAASDPPAHGPAGLGRGGQRVGAAAEAAIFLIFKKSRLGIWYWHTLLACDGSLIFRGFFWQL